MSWKAAGYVKELDTTPSGEPLTRMEKFLLLILADYTEDEHNRAWPSVGKLAKDCLTTERWVRRTLRVLGEKRILRITTRKNPDGGDRSNYYTIIGVGGYSDQGGWSPDQGGRAWGPPITVIRTVSRQIFLLKKKDPPPPPRARKKRIRFPFPPRQRIPSSSSTSSLRRT